ncbi:unnamed protein product [Caenorhabditis brenneri]
MENPAKFPLLYLPRLALDEVISMMVPFELINFSKISPRTERIVQALSARKRTYEVYLRITYDPSVTIRGAEVHWEFKPTEDKTKNNVIESHSQDRMLRYEYSENELQHCKKNYEYIKRILNFPITSVFYELSAFVSRNRLIIDWLKSHHESVEQLLIYSRTGRDDDLKYLLNNLKSTEYLKIHAQNELHFEWNDLLPQNLDFLYIEALNNISFQQLMRTNSKTVILQNSMLTSREINSFLKSWMESKSHSNLEFFEVNLENREAMDTILDLPHEYVTYETARIFKGYKNGRTGICGGIEIKQSSGKTGVMGHSTNGDKVSLELYIF